MLHKPELDGKLSDIAILKIFERLERDLAVFAETHFLFVRKFLRDYPMWGFYFHHPSGGQGSITLSIFQKAKEFGASVTGEWHVDDEAALARSTYEVPIEYITSTEATVLVTRLEEVLSRLIAAPASARSITGQVMERRRDESGKPVYGEFERSLQVAK